MKQVNWSLKIDCSTHWRVISKTSHKQYYTKTRHTGGGWTLLPKFNFRQNFPWVYKLKSVEVQPCTSVEKNINGIFSNYMVIPMLLTVAFPWCCHRVLANWVGLFRPSCGTVHLHCCHQQTSQLLLKSLLIILVFFFLILYTMIN